MLAIADPETPACWIHHYYISFSLRVISVPGNRLCARSTSMEHVLRSKGSSPVLSRAVSVSGAMVARSAKHPGDSAPLSTRNEECCRQRGMLSLEN